MNPCYSGHCPFLRSPLYSWILYAPTCTWALILFLYYITKFYPSLYPPMPIIWLSVSPIPHSWRDVALTTGQPIYPGIIDCQHSLCPQTLGLECRAANITFALWTDGVRRTNTLSCLSSRAITATCSVAVVNPQSQLNYFRAKHTVFVKYFH